MVKQFRQLLIERRTHRILGRLNGCQLFRRRGLREGNADHDGKSNQRIAHVNSRSGVFARRLGGNRCATTPISSLSLGELQLDASIAAIGILDAPRIDRLLVGKARRGEPRRGYPLIDREAYHR